MGSRRARGFDCDAYNERQIALRKQRPIEEVLRELRDGLSADVDRVEQLDEAFLLQTLPDFRGQVLPVSDQMRAYIGGHPSRHLDDIETAIGMAASPRGQERKGGGAGGARPEERAYGVKRSCPARSDHPLVDAAACPAGAAGLRGLEGRLGGRRRAARTDAAPP